MSRHKTSDPAGLGGIFKGIASFIDLLVDLTEERQGKEEGSAEEGKGIKRSREFRGSTPSGKEFRGVYGFSVRMGLGGPEVETFGNLRPEEEGAVVEERREPLVDVFDEGQSLQVVVELPGVEEESIDVRLADDVLILSTERGARKYHKEVLLPAPVEAESLVRTYRNGIFEVRLQKRAEPPRG